MSDPKLFISRGRQTKQNRYRSLPTLAFDALRVVPEPTQPTKNRRNDRLTDLIIIFLVFGIALWIRFWVKAVFLR